MIIPAPGSEFSNPGSRIQGKKIPDPHPRQSIYVFLTKKTVYKLSKSDLGCSSRIPDPDFFTIPDPDTGSATLPATWKKENSLHDTKDLCTSSLSYWMLKTSVVELELFFTVSVLTFEKLRFRFRFLTHSGSGSVSVSSLWSIYSRPLTANFNFFFFLTLPF